MANMISRGQLKKSQHENLIRLARFINLKRDIETMSHRQLANLIYWSITRKDIKKKFIDRGMY